MTGREREEDGEEGRGYKGRVGGEMGEGLKGWIMGERVRDGEREQR